MSAYVCPSNRSSRLDAGFGKTPAASISYMFTFRKIYLYIQDIYVSDSTHKRTKTFVYPRFHTSLIMIHIQSQRKKYLAIPTND